MRLSQFQELMADEFGPIQAEVLLTDLVLVQLNERTGQAAIAAGEDPREVWLAICQVMDVPKERWHGKPQKNKKPN
ncbi:MAG: DUF3046 domain-containing protein [Micrococcales bacterium]